MLFLAAGIGEAQVDELDLLLFDHFHHIIGRHCHFTISSGLLIVGLEGKLSAQTANKVPNQQNPCHSAQKKAGHCATRERSQTISGLQHQTGAKRPLCAPCRCESTPNGCPS
jgi:hypothetical protein